jgi:hypothetical protein
MERSISGFSKVSISDAIESELMFSNKGENVVVEANSSIHQYIITEVISGVLFVRVKRNVEFKSPPTIRVHITASNLDDIAVSGASSLTLLNDLVAPNVSIDISGASQMSGGIVVDNGSIELSGASRGQFEGAIGSANMDLSGASSLGNLSLSVDNLDIDLSGASSARLRVNNSIDISASGASTLEYLGDAVIKNSNLRGASSIRRL